MHVRACVRTYAGPESGRWAWEETELAATAAAAAARGGGTSAGTGAATDTGGGAAAAERSHVTAAAVERVAKQLAHKGFEPLPSQESIAAALDHTGGHVGKAVNRLTALLTARSHNTTTAAAAAVGPTTTTAATAAATATNDPQPGDPDLGNRSGSKDTDGVDLTSSSSLSSSDSSSAAVIAVVAAVDAEAVQKVRGMVEEKLEMACTEQEARQALVDTGGHVGKAVNRLSGLLTARTQVQLIESVDSPAGSALGDGVDGTGGGSGAGGDLQPIRRAAAISSDAVHAVVAKMAAKQLRCTEQEALAALRDAGGHVGKVSARGLVCLCACVLAGLGACVVRLYVSVLVCETAAAVNLQP